MPTSDEDGATKTTRRERRVKRRQERRKKGTENTEPGTQSDDSDSPDDQPQNEQLRDTDDGDKLQTNDHAHDQSQSQHQNQSQSETERENKNQMQQSNGESNGGSTQRNGEAKVNQDFDVEAETDKIKKAIEELQQFRVEGGTQVLSAKSQHALQALESVFNRCNTKQWETFVEAIADGALMVQTRRIMERRRHIFGPDSQVSQIVMLLLSGLLGISRDRRVVDLCGKHGVLAHIIKDLSDPILVKACVSPSVAKEYFIDVACLEMGILFDAIRGRVMPQQEPQLVDIIAKYVATYSDKLRLTALLLLSRFSTSFGAPATEIVATRRDSSNAAALIQKCMLPFVRGKRMRVNGFTLQDLLESVQDLMIANRGTIAALLDTDFPNWAVKTLTAKELDDSESAGVCASRVSRKERLSLVKCLETMSYESKARTAFNRKHPRIVHEMTKLASSSNKDAEIQKVCSTFVWQVKFGDIRVMKTNITNIRGSKTMRK